MDHGAGDGEERFGAYSEALAKVIGHADREQPLRDYCLGLLMPGERKSVEPMAALVAPARGSADIGRSCTSSARRLGRMKRC